MTSNRLAPRTPPTIPSISAAVLQLTLLIMLALPSLWIESAHAEICTPESPSQSVAPGVTYYDCSDKSPEVYIVAIDRSLPDMRIRLLFDPTDRPDTFNLKEVKDLAVNAGAVVAINGYHWEGNEGAFCGGIFGACTGTPVTSTFVDGEARTTSTSGMEVLMGFSSDGFSGIKAKRILDTQLNDPDNLVYRSAMYGANSRVMADGVCRPRRFDDEREYKSSITAYSKTHIFFVTTESPFLVNRYLDEYCDTLHKFGVTDAIRNDGNRSATLYVGESLNLLVPRQFPDRNVAYAVGLVPAPPATACVGTLDSDNVLFGTLCVTPDSRGYRAEFIPLNNGPARCGLFNFNLASQSGQSFSDQGAFRACTTDTQTYPYYFETGTLGGCATLSLHEREGNFGNTEWVRPVCGPAPQPGPIPPPPGPVDSTPPNSTAMATTPNANGWNNTDVTINFSATDSGAVLSGVRAIYVSLSGAQSGTTVIPGGSGSLTVVAEGITHVSYFAIDNAGNVEAGKSLTVRLDKTPPSIAGMPTAGCSLWPPNHKLVEVATVSAKDSLSGMAAFDTGASSNEPAGKHGPVSVITGTALQPRVVQLRAERFGNGSGREYTLAATASDRAGNVANASATCTVAHDQGHE